MTFDVTLSYPTHDRATFENGWCTLLKILLEHWDAATVCVLKKSLSRKYVQCSVPRTPRYNTPMCLQIVLQPLHRSMVLGGITVVTHHALDRHVQGVVCWTLASILLPQHPWSLGRGYPRRSRRCVIWVNRFTKWGFLNVLYIHQRPR